MEYSLVCLLLCAVVATLAHESGGYQGRRGYHGDTHGGYGHGQMSHGYGHMSHGGHQYGHGDDADYSRFRGMMYPGHRGAYIHGKVFHHDSDSDSDTHSDSESEDDDHKHGHHGDHRRGDRRSRHGDHHRRGHDDDESHEDDHDHHEKHEEDHKAWRFQIGDNFGAYEYVDENGYAKGFYIDLMRAVCARAGKDCYFVLDAYHNCWNTQGGQELPGVGLLDGYYDGCIGLLPSPDRLNSFNFTDAFTPDVECALHYKTGNSHADKKNVTGLTVGFVDGWALSKRCFERQFAYAGNFAGKYTPKTFETHQAMITALMRGQVDAVLTVDVFDANKLGIEAADHAFKCTTSGASVMAMYGSEVINWWNDAFHSLKEDGSFRQLCIKASKDHATYGEVNCLLD